MSLQIPLKTKILLLTVLPLIVLTATISWMYHQQATSLSDQQAKIFEENLMAAKRSALKDYVSLAMNSIAPVLEQLEDGLEPALAEYQIKHILRGLTYGSDGYFFVYDQNGVNLVHATQPELEGQNLYDFKDDTGKYVIRDLLKLAANGGGFQQYIWRKPTLDSERIKLGYVVNIPELNWMMGTGLYVDSIAAELNTMQEQVSANVRRSFWAATLVLVITLSMVVVIVTLVNMHTTQLADKHLQELANRFVTFQVIQRRGFARELHDGINQLLVSTKLWLNMAERQWPEAHAREHLKKAMDQLNTSIQEVRRVSHSLRPILLDDLGLEPALHGLLDEFEEQCDVHVKRRIHLPRERLPDAIEMTLYRLVQEAITNVRKHAKASNLTLSIMSTNQHLSLKMGDNGCGFSPEEDFRGIGLMNMRERVELLGGKFTVGSRRGGGTLIKAEFELNPAPTLSKETVTL